MSRCRNKSEFPLLLQTLALLVWFLCAQAQAVSVSKISWDSQPQSSRLMIQFDGDARYNVVDAVHDKGYYYVDFYGISVNYKHRLLDISDDFVRYADAVSYPDHGVLRLVVYVKDPTCSCKISCQPGPFCAVIDTSRETKPAGAASTPSGVTGRNVATLLPQESASIQTNQAAKSSLPDIPEPFTSPSPASSGRKKYVIIDAGHGGPNSGASSSALLGGRQVAEKELTLQFAYHLKKMIDASPNMVAFLTRSDDANLPLEKRVKAAEELQGDVFLSFHMNDGAGNPAARGVEFYYLDEKGTADAAIKAVEERENADPDSSGRTSHGATPLVKSLLTDLSRDKLKNLQYEGFLVSKSLQESFIKYPFYRNNCRGIKSANFLVLKNFRMPAVLVEVGFLTNSEDFRFLVHPQFQRDTAILVYNALNSYFGENDAGFRPHFMSLASSQP